MGVTVATTARGGFGVGRSRPGRLLGLVGVDDVDAHVGEHGHGVLDLLGGDFLGRKHLVQLVIGDEAAGLRRLDQLLDRGIGHVEHGTVGSLRLRLLLVLCFSGLGCHSFTPKRRLPLSATRSGRGRGAPDTRSAPTFGAYFTQAINGCSVNRQLSMTPCPRLTRRLSILAPSVGRLSLSPKQHGPSGQDRGRTTCRYFREVCSNSMSGPPSAGCSDTFAIRWIGMWPGESANAQPLDRPSPCSAGDPPVELVAGQHAAADQVPGLRGRRPRRRSRRWPARARRSGRR